MGLHNELRDFKSYKVVEYQPISPDITIFQLMKFLKKKKLKKIFRLDKKEEKRAASLFGQAVK